jgi:DNA replication regulator DPB11
VERGMVLDESLYDPTLAPGDRGKGAWNRSDPNNTVANGKRHREDAKAPELISNKRKLRRTMSAKLGNQQETLWADIASAGSGQANQDEWQPREKLDGMTNEPIPAKGGSASVTPDPTIEPLRKKFTGYSGLSGNLNIDNQSQGLFCGVLVYIHGFDEARADILGTHLKSNGARVCSARQELRSMEDSDNGYLIIPHTTREDELTNAPPLETASFQRVTEFWVESCLVAKALVRPDDHPLCKPFFSHVIEGMGIGGQDIVTVADTMKALTALSCVPLVLRVLNCFI